MEVNMRSAEIAMCLAEIIAKLQQIIDSINDDTETQIINTPTIPTIPFKDNPEFEIPQEWLDDWFFRYGELFVRKQLVRVRNWCLDNPAKQKYSGGGYRPKSFIGNWLSREASKIGHYVGHASTAKKYARKYSRSGNGDSK